jgi:hypothetical protein
VLLVSLLLVGGLAACGDDTEQTDTTTTTGVTTTTTTATTSTTPLPSPDNLRVYFLREEKVGPVARPMSGDSVAAEALGHLLTGPTEAEQQLGFSTTIPEGTEALGVTITDKVATVDLSEEFTSGGGSLSMMGRVAQVVFTLTQFPTIEAVSFEVNGEPLTVLGGEGLMLDAPQTRADWEDLTPAILVESPLPFAEVTSPLQIIGTANTFEATFQVNVTDADGLIVYDDFAMATAGNGTRGTFDITVSFDIARPGIGSVIVFELSAEDGSQVNVVEVPLNVA